MTTGLYGTGGFPQNVPGNDTTSLYGASSGNPVPSANGDLVVRGNLAVLGGNITTTAATATLFNTNATNLAIGGAATTLSLGASTGNTYINNLLNAPDAKFGNITIAVADDNTITTTTGDLKLQSATGILAVNPATYIQWAENSNRLNRLNFKSTNGTSTGIRVQPPIATGGSATASVNTTNDLNNTSFINLAAFQAAANPLRIQIGKYTAGVLGAAGTSVAFIDNATTYATVNPAGPTIGTDLITKTYFDLHPTPPGDRLVNGLYSLILNADGTVSFPNYKFPVADGSNNQVLRTNGSGVLSWSTLPSIVTYSYGATSTTGGANLTLTGSNSTTNTVKVANGTGVTVSEVSATEISVAIGQDVAVGATVQFNEIDGLGSPKTTQRLTLNTGVSALYSRFVDAGVDTSSTVSVNGTTGVTTINATDSIASTSRNWTFNQDGSTSFPSYKFPYADGTFDVATAAGQVLTTNGAGVLVWSTVNNLVPTYNTSVSAATGGVDVKLNSVQNATITIAGTTTIKGGTNISVTNAGNIITINGSDLNTTYTYTAGAVAGGANLTLTGSDATTNTVKLTNAGHITAVQTSPTVVTLGSDATDANTASTIVSRDASGNFSAGTITASLSGNATTATTANKVANSLTAGTHLSGGPFDGSAPVTLSTDATNANTASTIVARDASGNFSAGTITASLNGNATTATTATTANKVANSLTAGTHLSGGPFDGSAAVTLSTDATDANTASTIVARDASGNFSAGTITANLADASYVLGGLQATTNTGYTFMTPSLNTISNNNGLDAASSFTTTFGNAAQQQLTQYLGDTLAGTNTAPALIFNSATGNSVTGTTVPFTGVASVAPGPLAVNGTLGTVNFNGYATTNFSQYATKPQGGGIATNNALQIQSYAAETFADGTQTISGATITAVSRVNSAMSSVAVTGTRGQISFTSTTPAVGQAVAVTGTNSGSSTGISAGTYYIIVTNGSTTATLSATPGGAPITTTAGTTTGLSFARQFITVTYSAQSNIPFGANALIAVSGFGNVTSGTYMAAGTSTTTSVNIGAPTTVNPTLSGSQSLSLNSVSNGGAGLRVRAYPLATPMNSGNRVELINHTASTATYRADTFVISSAAYGTTGTARVTVGSTNTTFANPVVFPNYTAVALRAITGAVGWQAAVNNSPVNAGKMAYWDTTNARWSYIDTNLAV
jgi:hypothetical protein